MATVEYEIDYDANPFEAVDDVVLHDAHHMIPDVRYVNQFDHEVVCETLVKVMHAMEVCFCYWHDSPSCDECACSYGKGSCVMTDAIGVCDRRGIELCDFNAPFTSPEAEQAGRE